LQEDCILKKYVVVIDANNAKYALAFDASGNFINVKTLFKEVKCSTFSKAHARI
jgi:hypothetical protein